MSVSVETRKDTPVGKPKPPTERKSSQWGRRAPLLPALIFTIVLTQLPFVATLFISFMNWNAYYPDERGFAGLDNYKRVFTDENMRHSVLVTVELTATVVIVSLVLGMLIALLLDRKFFGRGAVRTMMIAPFLIVPVAAALLWKHALYNPEYGLFNGLLTTIWNLFGSDNPPQPDWISDAPLVSIEVSLIWQWTPFMMLILLAGLQSRPLDVVEAAEIDGASKWQIFRYMTFPHMRQYLELGALLGSIYVVATFDAVFVITSGGLGTANLPYTIYQTFYGAQDYGRASAAGVVVVTRNDHHRHFRPANSLNTVPRGGPTMTSVTNVGPVPATRDRAGSKRKPRKPRAGILLGVLAWVIGLIFIMPILWMVLTSFHSEADAATNPPSVAAPLTLQGYQQFFGASGGASPWPSLANSVTASVLSTALVLLLALPAAYALSIRPVRKWTDVMFFFLSTKMMPLVAALLPLYLFAQKAGLLDNIWLLLIFYTAMNVPIAVWMLRSFLAEVPVEMLEAASMDGAGFVRTLKDILAPVVMPGIAATALICFIFSWNELLFARVLTATVAQTSPVFLTGFVTSQGLFLAKVCAASLVVSLPVLIAGFAAQDKLVQGLSMGAVK